MSFFKSNKARLYSVVALATILALLVPMVSTGGAMEAFADTVDYYELKVGEDTIAVLETEEDAYDVISQLRDEYVDDEQNVVDVKMTPAVTVEKISVPKTEEQPEVEANVGGLLDTLLDSDESDNVYVVKEGDTLWDISTALGMSVDAIQKQNPDMDPDTITPGEEISVKSTDSFINVIVEYEVESEVKVPFETIYEDDPTMYADEEEYVKTEGEKGTKVITERVVKINGIIDRTEEVSSEMTKEPVSQVVVRGTLARDGSEVVYEDEEESEEITEEEEEIVDYSEDFDDESFDVIDEDDSEEEYVAEETYEEESVESEYTEPENTYSEATYSGSGQSVVDYALQFVGNPYVWGGTSLTNGCDCSGFVWRVFNDCGYSISRWPDDEFPHVSASELRPGDITRYGGHYAIYIGNGMEISAVNEEQGIRTHPMYYSYSSFWYGIRVIG